MRIFLHRNFKKRYKKLKSGEIRKFKERRDLFLEDQFHPSLNNHRLHGEYVGCQSIDITGDLRVHYEYVDADTVIFIIIGTHSELFG